MIAFVAREAEDPLLQDRISTIPERKCETHSLLKVTDSRETVLAPTVGARSRMVVREVLPGRTVRAVVFPHCAPGALAHVRAEPLPPPGSARGRIGEPRVFRRAQRSWSLGVSHWHLLWLKSSASVTKDFVNAGSLSIRGQLLAQHTTEIRMLGFEKRALEDGGRSGKVVGGTGEAPMEARTFAETTGARGRSSTVP